MVLAISLSFTYQGFQEHKDRAEPLNDWKEELAQNSAPCAISWSNKNEKPTCVDQFRPEIFTLNEARSQVSKTTLEVSQKKNCPEVEPAPNLPQKACPNRSLQASLKRYSFEKSGAHGLGGEAYAFTVESFDISIHKLNDNAPPADDKLHSHIEQRKPSAGERRSIFRLWDRFRSPRKSV